ncbi:DMT family transporter [Celerinatantimonas sp. YJH-8]|uniref:DMT family transporter n=1 Tax=Celerinatantimonas sp. YJH-8 TaxID=3228714 RepID=UPI0038CBC049
MGIIAILVASFLWGTTGTFASFTIQTNPLAIGAFATGFGGIFQVLWNFRAILRNRLPLLRMKKRIGLGALTVALYPLTFYSSMTLAGVATGTLISIATAPFATLLLEAILNHQNNLNRRWLISLILGLSGVILLTCGATQTTIHVDGNYLLGIGLGVVGGFCYAIYTWIAKTMIDQEVCSSATMGILFGTSSVLLLPTLFFTGSHLFAVPQNLAISCYLALIPMTLGYFLFGYGLRSIHASTATLLTLFEPLVAAILAVTVVGETLSPQGWTGALLILFSLLLISWRGSPHSKNKLLPS